MGRKDLPGKFKVLSSTGSPHTQYSFYAVKAGNNEKLVCQCQSDLDDSDDLALQGTWDGDDSSPNNDYTIPAGDVEYGSFNKLRVVSGTAIILQMNQ